MHERFSAGRFGRLRLTSKPFRAAFYLAVFLIAMPVVPGQAPNSGTIPAPGFDAASIKPPDPNNHSQPMGFYGRPGGRVFFGGNPKMLVEIAFNLQDYQVAGGPDWIGSAWYTINAVPPESSASRNLKLANAEPTSEQRSMLQTLLRDRFGLQCHFETKEGDVYLLSRGTKKLQLQEPKDPEADPRAIVTIKQGGIEDGEAHGTNTTMDYLAKRLGRYLQLPVLNQTGIAGAFDFSLQPVDPENHDMSTAVFGVMDRLGLKLKRGRGPIETLVIDHLDRPSEN
jgi:uncharacterized protein (TIGR03435 family)